MIAFAVIIFFIALIGIVALFSLKQWELSHERQLAPTMRMHADERALHIKELLEAGRKDLENLPPLFLHAVQRILHGIAVDAGYLAHWLGVQAHRLADSVSHKHNFERRETRSEFLKKVSEHKNGNGREAEVSSLEEVE